jgi:3-oxoacyl-[acyl-carrier-protein] synthase-3
MGTIRGYIAGTGRNLPDRVVTNDDLAKLMPTSDEWITQRSGIKERRWVEEGTKNSDLAIPACERAIEDAGIEKSDIDLVIQATLSGDHYFPGNGCIIAGKMGLGEIPAFDIHQQCSGFVYGLNMANAMIQTGQYKNILFVCSEVQSTGIDVSERGRNMAVLFADGAAACVIRPTDEDKGILHSEIRSDGESFKELWCDLPGSYIKERITPELLEEGRHFPYMNGRKVFMRAIQKMTEISKVTLEKSGVSMDDLKVVIPHQANLRISQGVADALGAKEGLFYNNIQRYGNTTAATIPIALDELRREGKVGPGDLCLFTAFGAGFTWGSALVRL